MKLQKFFVDSGITLLGFSCNKLTINIAQMLAFQSYAGIGSFICGIYFCLAQEQTKIHAQYEYSTVLEFFGATIGALVRQIELYLLSGNQLFPIDGRVKYSRVQLCAQKQG